MNNNDFLRLTIFVTVITIILTGLYFWYTSHETIVFEVEAVEVVQTPAPTPSLVLYEGKVSFYSKDGCLGCSENQTMGNGRVFDEMAMTLAVPCQDVLSGTIRYGTKVKVINTDMGHSVVGEITDCGGFRKYNRVADLSKGMYQELEAKTDITNIRIEIYEEN